MILSLNKDAKIARLSLRGCDILEELQSKESQNENGIQSTWHPEYASYMVEGTPGRPYGGLLSHFNVVEANMIKRREEVRKCLTDGETLATLTSFPRLGCPEFTEPVSKPTPDRGESRSLFFPDDAIYSRHPRFRTLTRNIRERRKEKVAINIPLFRDVKTPWPYLEDLTKFGADEQAAGSNKPNSIYMDAMGFGMGCCCLQMTFQACNIAEARTLYDQLAPLCPIMLALTAASPVHRGLLADTDCRWNVIAQSVDCRTREERGLEPLKEDKYLIPKSRYDSISSYISEEGTRYNDIPLVINEEAYKTLLEANVSEPIARHVAHLFIRDPVSLFSEKINLDDEENTDHFENIQSTNWQTMRFKPPPPHSSVGWRVEFRPCEVQFTDFENAAIVCFVVLLTRVMLSFNLNFLMPISKVDDNMQRAQKRDAVKNEKFFFRKDPLTANSSCEEMTVNEIVNGKEGFFPGLIPLILNFLNSVEVDADTHCTIRQYLKFISRRASGDLETTASWIRNFVRSHPAYKFDSVVSEEINYDLMVAVDEIETGIRHEPSLLDVHRTRTAEAIPAAIAKSFIVACQDEKCL
ncbi:glutamate--cysteine ligase catalytic subunit-like isoform X2 [Artemia franciscana]